MLSINICLRIFVVKIYENFHKLKIDKQILHLFIYVFAYVNACKYIIQTKLTKL